MKIFQKQKSNNSLFFTYLLTFVVIAIISLFCSFTYFSTNNRLKKIAFSESEQYLKQSTDAIGTSFLSSWEVFTDTFFINRIMHHFSSKQISTMSIHGTLLSLSNELNSRFYFNDYIQDVGLFIIDGETDYWCSTKVISADFREDYENGLYSFNDMSYDTYRDQILSSVDNRILRQDFYTGYVSSQYSNSYSCQAICLTYPIKIAHPSMKVYAVMQINMDKLQEKLTSFQYAGSYFGLTSNDQLIFSTDYDVDVTDILTKTPSGENNSYYMKDFIDGLCLTCYVSLDPEKIYQGIAPFSTLLISLFVILLIMIAIFIGFLFYHWLFPIVRMAAALPDSGNKNVIKKISQHMKDLSAKNINVQNTLLQHQKNASLRDIFSGKIEYDPDSELVPIGEENYRCVCIGCIKEEERRHVNSDYMIEQIENLSITAMAFTVFEDFISFLIIQPDKNIYANSKTFFEHLHDLLNILNYDGNEQYAIGISDVFNGTACIPMAYQEAKNSWESALAWQNAAVVFNTSLSQQYSCNYFVSYTLLDSLYQAIITNQKEVALKIFDQLVIDNFDNSKIGQQRMLCCQQFISDILGVLVRISNEFDIHAIIESYLSMNASISLKKRIALLRDAVIESCEFIPVHEYDNDLINAIFEYCEKHYADYQLSLSLLADQFHLSKSSISKYFKANLGINFSTYIEKLRIQHAEKLILENKLSVREIAEQVGYQNITTFYNAFRKVNKCTPTEWRQQKIIQQQNMF